MVNQIYVRGISKKATRESILSHFASVGDVVQLIWSGPENPQLKAICHVEYGDAGTAAEAVRILNHSILHGVAISVRLNLGAAVYSAARANSKKFISVPRQISPWDDVDSESQSESRNVDYASSKRRKLDADDSTIKHNSVPETDNTHMKPPTPPQLCSACSKKSSQSVRYTNDGLVCGGLVYPTPRGLYLMQLLQLSARKQADSDASRSILDVLLNHQYGNRQAKELSESMAMVTGTWRLFELLGLDVNNANLNVTVYALGDGKIPMTALMMALFLPGHWQFVSIDPLLAFSPAVILHSDISSRIHIASCLSQEYVIPPVPLSAAPAHSSSSAVNNVTTNNNNNSSSSSSSSSNSMLVSLVVACHSHAPLAEFWSRLPSTMSSGDHQSLAGDSSAVGGDSRCVRLAVSMPCCGKLWSIIPDLIPLSEYEDYEVFSARRRVLLYSDASAENVIL